MNGNVLICGAGGQLGCELQLTQPSGIGVVAASRAQLDVTNSEQIEAFIEREGIGAIINAAAYTAVDKAESEREVAMKANADAPGALASVCAQRGLRLVHVSTDFVFDGACGAPYLPSDATSPLGVYGESKLAGEHAVLQAGADAVIVRTGWVYSRHRGNFVKTMLRLMGERDGVNVVEDQIGTPTWARGLAEVCWQLLRTPAALGTFHWSDAGACSWYDFAVAIEEEGRALGLLTSETEVNPIPAAQYPTAARRPSNSVLDKTSTRALVTYPSLQWREQLRHMLRDHKAHLENAA